jgi:DNA-binding MurR/RpiR family transcriptional regulator
VVVALDLRRYDRWVLDWVERAAAAGAALVVLTDSAVSPLARAAGEGDQVFVVAAESAGPFDTYVGALALFDALIAGVADRTRAASTDALDRVEAAWRDADVLAE